MRLWFALVMALVLVVLPVTSQDASETGDGCDSAALADTLAELVDAVRGSEDAASALREVALAAGAASAACNGLAFSGEDITSDAVVGPVIIPAGVYVVSISAEGEVIITLEVTELEGDCGVFGGFIFIAGADGDQEVLEVDEGCEALLSFSAASMEFPSPDVLVWDVTFDKLR